MDRFRMRWLIALAVVLMLVGVAACGEAQGAQTPATTVTLAIPTRVATATLPGAAATATVPAGVTGTAVTTVAVTNTPATVATATLPAATVTGTAGAVATATRPAGVTGTPAAATNTPAAVATATRPAGVTGTPAAVTGTPVAAATATRVPAVATAQARGTVTLNSSVSGNVEFWHFWGSPVRRTAIRRVIAICKQKLPNINVTEVFKPFGDIWTANIAAVAAGSGMPDVIVEDRPKLPQLAADGVEQSLQSRATRDGITGERYWPFAWDQTLYNNETYGIPYETEVRVLFWNKNAFREVGLDPEKPPKTWDEVEAYADRLDKRTGNTWDRIGFFPLWNIGPDVWAYTNGHDWESADGRQVFINDPKVIETLTWIKSWVDRYGGWQAVQAFRGQFGAPPNDPFMSGKVAMIVDINGYSSQLAFYRPRVPAASGSGTENMEWGISDIPYNVAPGSWSGGFALSIPRGARNADAAWEFIKCATDREAQVSWARDTASIPGNIVAATDPVLMADPEWAFFIQAMGYTTGGDFVPAYPNWGEQLNQRLEAVWTGQLTPAQAAQQAQQAVDQVLQRR